MKKVLVTGGAGFIGSNLCERLAKNSQNEVISLDNYSSGSASNHIKGVQYIEGDTSSIEKLVNFSPDLVFHLGEYSRVEQSFDDLDLVWESNKQGTFKVLQFCLKNNSKIIYAGSSTKFGDGGLGRMQSPYGWTKASNTELVKNFSEWYGLEYAITYFYNVYGKREIKVGKYATLIGIFQEQMKNSKPLTIVRPGSQRRNFTNIDDITAALDLIGEKGFGDNFGIGNPSSYSVDEIADLFGGKKKYIPERKGNRMNSSVNIRKTLDLGWSPKYSIEDYVLQLKENRWN